MAGKSAASLAEPFLKHLPDQLLDVRLCDHLHADTVRLAGRPVLNAFDVGGHRQSCNGGS